MKSSATVLLLVFASTFFLSCSTAFGLESHPGYTRSDPPPSGYWYSNVPGNYNPWTDDIRKPLLTWSPENKDLSSTSGSDWKEIKMLEEGWDNRYYNRPRGPQTDGD